MKPYTLEWWLKHLNYYRKQMDHWIKFDLVVFNLYRRKYDWVYERIIKKYGEK